MQPLEGIRVFELCFGWAGLTTSLLGRFGAEVIKVETRKSPDFSRMSGLAQKADGSVVGQPSSGRLRDLNASKNFNETGVNKLSMALNIVEPRGLELAKRLIAKSDVMVVSFSPGTIERLGLGYDVVREIKPDIVMLSASANPGRGPEYPTWGFAPVFLCLGGVGEMTGYPDGPPHEARVSGDYTNAYTAFYAIMAALWYREKTGKGQFIDYSSREGQACTIGEAFMDYVMNGRVPSRRGNRDDLMAPHNGYPCRGDDRWVSIAVSSEEEWQALCHAMGDPPWATNGKFGDAYSRRLNQGELDVEIGRWTINYSPYEVMGILQEAGVAAVPAFTAADIYTDPHLAEREMFRVIEHPVTGASLAPRVPWKLAATPETIRRHAPLFGEHTAMICKELLGVSEEEVTILEEEKVLW